jgi:hypothetical protein
MHRQSEKYIFYNAQGLPTNTVLGAPFVPPSKQKYHLQEFFHFSYGARFLPLTGLKQTVSDPFYLELGFSR